MKKSTWQKYLSLLLSLVIVFNITMVPVFADEKNSTDAQAQEEQVEGETSTEDKASTEEPVEAPSEAEQEPSESEQEEEQPSDDAGQEPAEQEPSGEEPSDEPAEAPSEAEPEEHVGGEGKYVKDVYIAYGKTEDEAKEWLRKNGWEPLTGNADFNAGKASAFDDDVAAVMGIKRTDKKNEAITDMAVMNMKGGYSFPDYQTLVKEKKSEISEFINSFIPVLEEYRTNYNGKGSSAGKKRAELAHELLNKFYDGGKDEPYAVNDTGKPLGDLFLEKIMQEGNDKGGDLQQIILESSGPAVTAVEISLALAADSGEDTWIERLQGLSGDELAENLGKYVPEAKGQDVAPSAVNKFLKQHFGDTAKQLASQWGTIKQRMLWLENYNEEHDLWQHDGESEDAYGDRMAKHFSDLDKEADDGMSDEHEDYIRAYALYTGLYETPYEGDWGESLGDFFNPAEGDYEGDTESFLPFAAALSKGQRASADLVSLETLLMLGMGTEESIKDLFPQVKELFKDADNVSIYAGMNRGIFRGGVALTSAALMEKNQNGYDPFADMWSFSGIYNITVYAAAIAGVVTIGAGIGYLSYIKHTESYVNVADRIATLENRVGIWENSIKVNQDLMQQAAQNGGSYGPYSVVGLQEDIDKEVVQLEKYQKKLEGYEAQASKMTVGARVIMGVGGALLVGAAMAKGYQLYRYYQKTFTQIPMYIVDEADIVSYETDDEGNETKLIDFDQFVYYKVAECNRQEVGKISDWQDGVSDYVSWGCGDAADLNGDFGQQWLALYTVKSEKKGYPILADSLTLQYGSNKMPEGTTRALHMFTYENAVDLGDMAYSYNNDKNGVYFFWDVDEKAYEGKDTASTFAGGKAAIAGGVGLLIGVLGTALVMRTKKKKEEA